MTDKNRRQFWIRRKGREKFTDTKPERGWFGLAALHEILTQKVDPFPVILEDGKVFTYTPDAMVKGAFIEPDGVVHATDIQERKTRRRDAVLYDWTEKRILHIDGELLSDEEWWDYVALHFWLFRHDDCPSYHVCA